MGPRKRKIKVFPREGLVDFAQLTVAKGICHHPDCKGKRISHLQYHCKKWHSPNSKRILKLSEIPADLNVNPDDLVTGKGVCHHADCKGKGLTGLRRHFLAYHLKQSGVKRTNKLTEIPANLNCKVEDIYSDIGKCHHEDCKGSTYSHLKEHFRVWHSPDSRRIHKLSEIPADLKVNPEDLVTGQGICHHVDCKGKQVVNPKRHLLEYHLKQNVIKKGEKLKEIPVDLDCKVEDIYAGEGICHHLDCKGRKYLNLKDHFRIWHGPLASASKQHQTKDMNDGHVDEDDKSGLADSTDIQEKPVIESPQHFIRHVPLVLKKQTQPLEKILRTWNGNAYDLTSKKGKCYKKGCNKTFKCLRTHYIKSHVHHPTAAEFGTSFAPAKCAYCGATGVSPVAIALHMRQYHVNVKENFLKPITLSLEETRAYYAEKDKAKEELSGKPIKKGYLTDLGIHLQRHLQALKDSSHPTYIRAARVKMEFESLFENPVNTKKSINAAFISFVDRKWRIPKISFEIVEKSNGEVSAKSRHFVQDPRIRDVYQAKRSDYSESGYHRGHLVPAGNYSDISHAAPTYYYSNIVPMCPKTNWGVRRAMEVYIKDVANTYGQVRVAHFPIMGKHPRTLNRRVTVPDGIGTVMFVTKPIGTYVKAWELPNDSTDPPLEDCTRNPLALLQKAKIDVKFSRSSFKYWSLDARKNATDAIIT